jgi:hypothetical protein
MGQGLFAYVRLLQLNFSGTTSSRGFPLASSSDSIGPLFYEPVVSILCRHENVGGAGRWREQPLSAV